MHKNRELYSLTEYQKVIRHNYEKLGIVLEHNDTGNLYVFRPIPATPWLPEGRKKYYQKLRAKLQTVKPDRRYTFCTLTYSANLYTPTQAARRLKRDIDLFFKRLDYRKSKPEYFYCIELTDRMMVHVHCIFDRFVHKTKVFASWKAITGCTAVKIKHIPGKSAFFYVTKYLNNSLKQAHGKWAFLFKNVARIWTASRRFFSSPAEADKLYTFKFMYKSGFRYDELYEQTYFKNGTWSGISRFFADLLYSDAKDFDCIIREFHPDTFMPAKPVFKPDCVQDQFDFFNRVRYQADADIL